MILSTVQVQHWQVLGSISHVCQGAVFVLGTWVGRNLATLERFSLQFLPASLHLQKMKLGPRIVQWLAWGLAQNQGWCWTPYSYVPYISRTDVCYFFSVSLRDGGDKMKWGEPKGRDSRMTGGPNEEGEMFTREDEGGSGNRHANPSCRCYANELLLLHQVNQRY